MKRLILLVAAAAVAAPPSLAHATLPPTPTLDFNADWSVQASGAVISGMPVIIHYDIARLPSCRTQYMGYPAWDILAYWSTDGGPAHYQTVTRISNGARVGADITITVPPGRDFTLWFYASDESGCVQWDSDYGQNFHFPTEPGPPAVHFPYPGWTFSADDTVANAAGGPLLIDYDIRRMSSCRQDYNGLDTWVVTAFYSFDGAPASSGSLTTTYTGGRASAPLLINAPAGARTLTIWFENSDRTGCTAWDSRFGANYTFAIAP
jgi:hypothetical protein